MGVIIGTMMKIIPNQSINMPKLKQMNITTAKEAHRPPGVARMKLSTTFPPPKPRNTPVNM
ncbi:unnamed protein product [marine sediment metagenome]|uniref:Uncharacterized protein n=1 Tax=marine sediment metagenome TaxID=412755 RepID=X1STW0_9ZZZZ